jgi:hypothetical protein
VPLLKALRALPDRRAGAGAVGAARALVGAAGILAAVEVASELRQLHNASLLRLPRIESLPEIPAGAVNPFLGCWVLAALAFAFGWHTRVAGTTLGVCIGYVLALDRQLYSNHLYLMLLLVTMLTLAGSGAAFSLDSRRNGRQETVPAWPVILMRAQISLVYGFAVLAKLTPVYLSGAVLATNMRLPGLEHVPPVAFALLAAGSVMTEAFLSVALWSRRLRPAAFLVGFGFHLSILFTMRLVPDLITFPLVTFGGYLAFVSPISAPGTAAAPRAEVPAAA